MLSRTADSIFWLARYMERAEDMSRLVDMGRRMSAIPGVGPDYFQGRRSEWPAVLAATGCTEGYNEHRYTEDYADLDENAATLRYLLTEPKNPASVRSAFEAARANARSARAALTREMWEVVNDSWIHFTRLQPESISNGSAAPLLEMIKSSAALFRGAADSSALRNDSYCFLRLGFAVERMDCTARLLDVKAARNSAEAENGVVDRFRWMALLRAAGQHLAYRAHYRADYNGALIAEFLIKRPESPRSLMCLSLEIEAQLLTLARLYGDEIDCMADARALTRLLSDAQIDIDDPKGTHEFLSEVIEKNSELATAIANSFHFGPSVPQIPATEQAIRPDAGEDAASRTVESDEDAAERAAQSVAEALEGASQSQVQAGSMQSQQALGSGA